MLQYCVYFFFGVAVGAGDIGHSLVAHDGRLAWRWSAWAFAAMMMSAVDVVLIARHLMSGLAFVLCCGATTFACWRCSSD